MRSRYKVSVHAHKKKGKANCTLFLVVSVAGERKELSAGISCPVDAYVPQSQSIIPIAGYTTALQDNLHLQQKKSKIERIFKVHELDGDEPTLADILKEIEGSDKKKVQSVSMMKVTDAYQKYLDSEQTMRGWAYGTYKHKKSVGENIKMIVGNRLLNSVDDLCMKEILEHHASTMKARTLDKFIGDVKTFLRWCAAHDLYKGNSHNTFKPVIKGANDTKEIIYLTAEELSLLKSHKWGNDKHLERVVDSFLFACYSGLRHSDVFNLKRSSIHDGCIHARIIKTGALVAIPLNEHTQQILDKYKDYHDRYDHPFPVISDQKSNKEIKTACKHCGIDTPTTVAYYQNNERIEETKAKYEWVSFHCARRTFVTQAFMLGIPAEIIAHFTAHSDLRQLKPYLKLTEQHKKEAMSKFNTL